MCRCCRTGVPASGPGDLRDADHPGPFERNVMTAQNDNLLRVPGDSMAVNPRPLADAQTFHLMPPSQAGASQRTLPVCGAWLRWRKAALALLLISASQFASFRR